MRKKQIIAVSAAFALACTALTGCGGSASETSGSTKVSEEETQEAQDYAGQSLTGRVSAIDGTRITVELGEISDQSFGGGEGQPGQDGGTPPEMPDGGENAEPGDTDAPEGEMRGGPGGGRGGNQPKMNDGGNQPEMTDGEEPPELPEGEEGGEAPSEMPGRGGGRGGEQPEMEDGEEPPELPEGEEGGGTAPEMAGDMGMPGGFQASGETAEFDIDGAEILIEASSEDVEATEGTLDDIVVGAVLTVEVDSENAVSKVTVLSIGGGGGGFGGSGEVSQGASANTIDTDGEYSDTSYSSTGDDENALRVDGAEVTLNGITVEKSAGASSNTEDGDFYGMNAALLATDGANVTITNAEITSSAQNGNGVFSYGSGTVVNISDSIITTTADNSGGIQTTGGGTTNAASLTVETSGSSSASIRSDRGGGTVLVEGGSYTSNGYNSPAVYSTADITVKDASLTANHSEALVIEGKNSIALENCEVSGNMSDDKGTSSDENVHSVMIYQSMSGDADVGTSSFSMKGGSLVSNNGDVFYVTNTACTIHLSGVEITDKDGTGYLLNICGNSASHGWGTAGRNGAQVVFTADGQTLEGDIVVDTISTLDMTLSGGSAFTGTVNIVENAQNGSAVSDNAVVTIQPGSTWTLTGNCTITSLENKGTINFNGYQITLADGTVLS